MKTLSNFRAVAAYLLVAMLAVVWSCKKEDAVPPKSSEKAISAFSFGSLSPAVVGVVSGNSITASVPFGTNLNLAPTISVSAKATVSPAAGVVQDFSKAVTYTVTAEDATTQSYTVTVTVGAAPKSAAKAITGFAFNGLNPAVACAISGTSITATLPAGTDATKLVPTITTSAKATVSPATGAAQDFSKDVTYTVTAEDGSTQVYTAKITIPKLTTVTVDCDKIPEVWEDLGDGVDYIVKCNINVGGSFRGAKSITIKPGVKIQFANGDAGFTIVNNSFLKMIGTAAKPIVLEGSTATAGFWKGVDGSEANNLENVWEYVTIRHAGSTSDLPGGFQAGLFDYKSQFSIKNCTFSDNKGHGIVIGKGAESNSAYGNVRFFGFQNNTFLNNTKSAMRIHFTQWGYLDTDSDYSKNGQNYVEVYGNFGGDKTFNAINDEMTVKKLNVPYRFFGIMAPSATVTFLSGVEIQFGTDAGFFIGEYNKTAAIIANGTAANPIKFTGYLPNIKGVWAGISAQNGNLETKFNYCIIDGAGSSVERFFCVPKESKAAIYLGLELNCTPQNSRGTITNCTITNSGGYGIAYRLADAVTAKDNTFKDNTKTDVYNFK